MALNTDFRVKDSLYVGNSACFVTQTDTPKILSAGTELFDIFLQEGEIAAQCSLTNGTGIATLDYDGSVDTTIAIDSACNTKWNSAATWCSTNGNNVIDTVAEGNAQGRIAVTNIGNTTSQVDVNGLQTSDNVQFAGMCLTGAFTTSSTVDGRDIAADAAQLAILQGLSAGNITSASSPSQGTVRITDQGGNNTDIETGLQNCDNVQFVDICATGNITTSGTVDGRDIATDAAQLAVLQGLSAANIVDSACTAQGEFRIEDASGTCTAIDVGLTTSDAPTFAGLDLTGVSAGTDNTVLVLNGSTVVTDEIDSRVWGSSLVDGSGTTNQIPLWSDGNTVGNSSITQDANGITIGGGLSASGTLSGDGSGLTGVTATPTFPTVGASGLTSSDKLFVNNGTSCETACNKHITYCNLLNDIAGTGLTVASNDSICLAGSTALTNCNIPMWNSGSSCFLDTVISQSSTGNINIAGGLTVMDNLSVMGDFTCIDTTISTTSALSVVNAGTGPALYAEQTGASQPIAKFVDTEGGQVVIGDTGNVGIGGSTDAPSEKLVVTGSACVSSNLTVGGTLTVNSDSTFGNAAGDDVTFNSAVINAPNIASGTQTGNQVLARNGDDEIVLDSVDSKIFNTKLVDSNTDTTCQNQIPKFSNSTGTIANSNISDSGTEVTISSDILIGTGKKITTKASASVYSEEAAFTDTVDSTETTVTTFTKSGLKSVEYQITLIKGVNITTFRVNAVYNGSGQCGTTYAIVDAQAATQLADIEISSTGSTIDLDITAASDGTTAIIQGTALYS